MNEYLRSGEPQTLDLILTTTINSEKTVVYTKPLVKSPTLPYKNDKQAIALLTKSITDVA